MKTKANSKTLSPELLQKLDAYWRAANYLSGGQIYLYDNPLLKRPLTLADVKHMLLGHWGTTPGQNFIYVHLNRVIKKYDLDMIYVSGPGHGGPAAVGNTYLEGTYRDRKSTRLNSSHLGISYAVFCLKKKTKPLLAPAPIGAPACGQLAVLRLAGTGAGWPGDMGGYHGARRLDEVRCNASFFLKEGAPPRISPFSRPRPLPN